MTSQPRRGSRGDEDVVRITSAPRGHDEDQSARIRRYVISMGIRTACVVLAFLTSGPLQWVMIAGAVLLPYVAVVFANAGRERTEAPSSYANVPPSRPELPPAAFPATAPAHDLRAEDTRAGSDGGTAGENGPIGENGRLRPRPTDLRGEVWHPPAPGQEQRSA